MVIELDELLSLEEGVWHALRTGDPRADMESLAPDFLGVYPSGLGDRTLHAEQLVNGPTVASFEILDPQIVTISTDHALLVYRADYRRPDSRDHVESMYVSSLWSNRNGRWINIFSQDTPIRAGETVV